MYVRFVVTNDVGNLLPARGINHIRKRKRQSGPNENIRKRDALTDQPSRARELLVEGGKTAVDTVDNGVKDTLVVRVHVAEDTVGVGGRDENLGLGEIVPLRDFGGEFGVGGDEGRVGAGAGHC